MFLKISRKTELLVFLFIVIINSFTYAQNNQDKFLIHGQLLDVDTGTVYLHSDNNFNIISSVKIKGGEFILEGRVSEPIKATLTTGSYGNIVVPIFIENAKYDLAFDPVLNDYRVSGGTLNQQFMNYAKSIMGYFEGWSKIKSILKNETLWKNPEQTNSIRLELEKSSMDLEKMIIKNSSDFINENLNSYAAPRAISNILILSKNYVDIVQSLFNKLDSTIQISIEGKDVKNRIDNIVSKPKEGDKIYKFKLKDNSGKEYSFETPKTGALTLINFWASWCGPCIQEIPSLNKVHNIYKKNDFDVINISLDSDPKRWLNFLDKNTMSGKQLIDNHSAGVSKYYRVTAIPSNLLIDENGKIIGTDLSFPDLEKELVKRYGSK